MSRAGYPTLAYLDDFAGYAPTYDRAVAAYVHFKALMNDLGLALAKEKCQPPAQNVTWLGFTINTETMELSVPQQKINEIYQECDLWVQRKKVTQQQLQSFLGKILHVAACIRHARKFTARMLETLRNMKDRTWTTIGHEFKADVRWFREYASKANGISIYAPVLDFIIECDACLSGAGGNSATHFYSWVFDEAHTKKYSAIHHLEALNIIVTFRTLCPKSIGKGCGVLIYTDNISSSYALSSGKTRDPVLAACARQLWHEAAIRDIEVRIEHKPGTDIPLADALSRMHMDTAKNDLVLSETKARNILHLPPVLNGYVFFNNDL